MDRISKTEIEAVYGRLDDLVLQEMIRTEATPCEFRSAVDVASGAGLRHDLDDMPPRIRRLVDLCTVAVGDAQGARTIL